MPTLDFKGKSEIHSHHLEVPFCDLRIDQKKSFVNGKSKSKWTPSLDDHLIIHGDNLYALKALLPQYAGQVKCIYIDPPYNTGNENWVFNDNVNSPLMREWLHKTIDSDDLERHDKWLCMMWPRLHLLKELLSEDGVIFVSIDSNEQGRLMTIMDEIFKDFVCLFTWVRKKKGSFLSSEIRKMTEFILCYKKNNANLRLYGEPAYTEKQQPIVKRTNSIKLLSLSPHTVQTTLNNGIYKKGKKGTDGTGIEFLKDFEVKDGFIHTELKVKGRFVWTQSFLDKEIANKTEIHLSKKFGFNVLRYNQQNKVKAPSTLINMDYGVGTNEDATQELINIFNKRAVFDYNKPTSLIKFLIKTITNEDKNAIILDSFAGSGTTAHAVLELNKEDNGNRKFILVECEDYAHKTTSERVRRIIRGIPTAKDDKLKKGLGGSFTYCTLGDQITEETLLQGKSLPSYEVLSKYVFYTATGQAIHRVKENKDFYVTIVHEDTAFFVIYKPDQEFLRSDASALHLDRKRRVQEIMKQKKCSQAIVFASACFYPPEELSNEKITFAQLPFAIHRIVGA